MTFPLDKSSYKIIHQIGKGSTAVVYAAECLNVGKTVALKMINLETYPAEIESLRHEVAFWSSSKSPNIVDYYGSFVEGSILYIVMEFMSAGSCHEILRNAYQKGIPDEGIIAAILHEVVLALIYFHNNKQIHRDVKAGNILINDEGNVKIGDFGIAANLLENGQRKNARFTVIGTPCYMAPEVLREEEGYTEKADIWSLGITAIELALGAAPYSSQFPLEVIVKIVNSPPPQLPDDRKFSSAFRDFVKTCLMTSPAKRPTAQQLIGHKFLKNVKDIKGMTKKFIESLPPLQNRFRAFHNALEVDQAKKIEPKVEWNFSFDDNPPKDEPIQIASKTTESPANEADPKPKSTVSKVGKFTITKNAAPVQAAHLQPSPEQIDEKKSNYNEDDPLQDEKVISILNNELTELKSRVTDLKSQNDELKSLLNELTSSVRQLIK